MKYKLFFAFTLGGLCLGGGLMYFLLTDENKWGKAEYLPEFYGGTFAMGLMGVALGVLSIKGYLPARASGGELPNDQKMAWLCVFHWGTMGLLVAAVLAIGSSMGVVTKANGPLIAFATAFVDGLYTTVTHEDTSQESSEELH